MDVSLPWNRNPPIPEQGVWKARTLQSSLSPEDPGRIMAHLVEHLANYSQYFEMQQRGPDVIELRIREVIARQWQLQKPHFLVRVTPSRPGCKIALQRTLAPVANWFLGIFTGVSAIALVGSLAVAIANPAERGALWKFMATAAGLTLAGLVLRQLYYWAEAGRDPELTGILQKALADFGRPTAVRRREAARGPGTMNP